MIVIKQYLLLCDGILDNTRESRNELSCFCRDTSLDDVMYRLMISNGVNLGWSLKKSLECDFDVDL